MLEWMLGWWIVYQWEMEERRQRMAQLTRKQFEALAEANPSVAAQLIDAGIIAPVEAIPVEVKPLSSTGRTNAFSPNLQRLPTPSNVPKWMKPEDKVEIRFLLKGLALKGLGAILGSQAI